MGDAGRCRRPALSREARSPERQQQTGEHGRGLPHSCDGRAGQRRRRTSSSLTQARQLYFFGDDWAFLLSRHPAWPELMEPHNEHWSTLPMISFRIMFHVFGIDHYLAYAVLAILLHAACCVLLYR